MSSGLLQRDLDEILDVLRRFPQIEKALFFGSRAKGNFKRGSDVDIAIMGENIDYSCISALSTLLNEESMLPYYFDIVHLESVTDKPLLEHIHRVGKTFYVRKENGSLERHYT
jgi:predicted nucleotidyltransferase